MRGAKYGLTRAELRYGSGEARVANRAVLDLERVSAAEANAPFLTRGWTAPYAEGAEARAFTAGRDMEFVRVHGELNQHGAFIVRAKEIAGMTPEQIQAHLALPYRPTYISDVLVPAETRLQMGWVGAQPSFGFPNPGGIQYQLLDQLPASSFINMRPLP